MRQHQKLAEPREIVPAERRNLLRVLRPGQQRHHRHEQQFWEHVALATIAGQIWNSQRKPIKFAVSILQRHCQPPRITVLRQAS